MGALPKNKITRAERGKRRAGNTPDLKKDPHVHSVPLYKRGLINSMLVATGLKEVSAAQLAAQKAETEKRHKKAPKKINQPLAADPELSKVHAAASTKPTTGRKTQHKG